MGGFSLILLLCRSVRLVCLRGTTETAMDMYVTSVACQIDIHD